MPWIHRSDTIAATDGKTVALTAPQIISVNLDGLWRITFYMIPPKPGDITIDGVDAAQFLRFAAGGPVAAVSVPYGGAVVGDRPVIMRGLMRVSIRAASPIVYVREWIEFEDE